jgi:hypothetical protein
MVCRRRREPAQAALPPPIAWRGKRFQDEGT